MVDKKKLIEEWLKLTVGYKLKHADINDPEIGLPNMGKLMKKIVKGEIKID